MKTLMYVGGYTDGQGCSLRVMEADTGTGAFRLIRDIPKTSGHTYLCINRAGTRLYAGGEDLSNPAKGKNGAVIAYAIEGDRLEQIGVCPLGPFTVPCHVSLSPDEKTFVWAEYTCAFCGATELDADGNLSRKTVSVQNIGDGPNKPRQDKAHAHCAVVSPDGRYLCVVDLGIDQVKVFDFAGRAGGLRECEDRTIRTEPGLGPRHFIFHPNGHLAFLVYELGNAVSSFRYDGDKFTLLQTVSMLPGQFTGDTKAAAIKISEDGKRLFASNRGHDSIAVYDIDTETGSLTLLTIDKLVGKVPRDFTFMPGEAFAVVGHKMSHELMSYRYDKETGKLEPLHNAFAMHRPTCIVFPYPKSSDL